MIISIGVLSLDYNLCEPQHKGMINTQRSVKEHEES